MGFKLKYKKEELFKFRVNHLPCAMCQRDKTEREIEKMLMTIDRNSDFDWDLANLFHGLTHNMIGKQFLYFTQSEKLVWLYELARDINKGVPVLGAK